MLLPWILPFALIDPKSGASVLKRRSTRCSKCGKCMMNHISRNLMPSDLSLIWGIVRIRASENAEYSTFWNSVRTTGGSEGLSWIRRCSSSFRENPEYCCCWSASAGRLVPRTLSKTICEQWTEAVRANRTAVLVSFMAIVLMRRLTDLVIDALWEATKDHVGARFHFQHPPRDYGPR